MLFVPVGHYNMSMILIDQTQQMFGYHPGELTSGSKKRVIYACSTCKKETETRRNLYREGLICKVCSRTANSNKYAQQRRAYLLANSESIDIQLRSGATQEKYGYLIEELGRQSSKYVIYECAQCGSEQSTQYKGFKPGHICKKCSNANKSKISWDKARSQGRCPNGGSLDGLDKENARRWHRERAREWRKTPIGQITVRLRNSLRRALGNASFSKNLPYTPQEARDHIQAKLVERNFCCPMCKTANLHDGYDVDHRIPLSTATTVEEVKALFALHNLDVLCLSCNRGRKWAKHVEY